MEVIIIIILAVIVFAIFGRGKGSSSDSNDLPNNLPEPTNNSYDPFDDDD